MFPNNFDLFFNELLCCLAKNAIVETKRKKQINRIMLKERKIFVSTKRSGDEYKEIPLKFIQITYDYLVSGNELTQEFLSKSLYVKRSAFIFASFSLLDFVEYDFNKNSIKFIHTN